MGAASLHETQGPPSLLLEKAAFLTFTLEAVGSVYAMDMPPDRAAVKRKRLLSSQVLGQSTSDRISRSRNTALMNIYLIR
ncbi:hypothetical protein Bind_2374 [Beijerinckia indica subsp. indica ATCC 9039]|uniref:Uncharacterized protein n=1 Tax=Beijerinckia indica subsp. indica (strain ATCC 9039 / DSM 1715 / NCIMB 8712) TaxID=395963 RepID=B2IHU2_BEII9|nr:hypothetical protein Bind_2374 [Beijerinckia indica subsp. indica ATCC 9039]